VLRSVRGVRSVRSVSSRQNRQDNQAWLTLKHYVFWFLRIGYLWMPAKLLALENLKRKLAGSRRLSHAG
jgi:hypothetical protein